MKDENNELITAKFKGTKDKEETKVEEKIKCIRRKSNAHRGVHKM